MLTIEELSGFLSENGCEFEIIRHDKPIHTAEEGAKYFDAEAIAPTLIVETERGLYAVIVSAKRGHVDFSKVKQALGFSKMKMADAAAVKAQTGYRAGALPFIGHGLKVIFDRSLLERSYIVGGSGDELATLKIAPADIVRLSDVAGWIEQEA